MTEMNEGKMIEKRIQEARELHQKGQLPEAIERYAGIVADEPERADIWHLKGMAEHHSGRLAAARQSVERAIEAGGARPSFLMLDAALLHDAGDLAGAEARLRRVLEEKADWAAAHVDLGRVHMDQGQVAEALKDFQAAVSLDPSHVRAWNNLGIALQSLDRLDDAVRAFNHTLSLDPRYPLAHFNLARIYNLRGDARRALDHAQQTVREDGSQTEAWLLIGDIYNRQRETTKALAAYSAAARAAPGNMKARAALADAIAGAGGFEQARTEYRRMQAQFPGHLRTALGANLLLPQVYSSVEQVETVRGEYVAGLERLREAAPRFRYARPDVALSEARWTNFYLAYQGKEDVALQSAYGDFLREVLAPAMPQFFRPPAPHPARQRIRVGFLSHFFFNCTAGRYFSSWITHLDRDRFETYVYYTNEWVADDTRAIAAAAHAFRHLPGRPLYTLAQHVAGDALDILVYPELGMHPETFTLAALRLAPVQCSGWGHPTTTGHPEIDWFISCEAMEPEGAQRHYRERLALLPGLGTRYAIPKADAGLTRADFGLPEDRTLYLVPQSLFKIHPDNDELIAQVLARDPRGVAVLFASHHQALMDTFVTRLAGAFARHNLDIHERTRFLAPFMPHPRYLALNRVCDVMLDTMHWSGGNTSLDALASGLPVVTRPGALMRSRQSQAMLAILGVPELVTADFEGHVETTVRLGRDADLRADLARRIQANLGELFERDEPVRALEAFLEKAVRGA